MRFLLLLPLILLIGACSASQTQKANELMASQYLGKPADQFFLKFGPPSTKYVLDGGDTMYLWAENAAVYGGNGGIVGAKQTLGTQGAIVTNGVVVQCEVRIVASPDGVIRQILAQNDTVGEWQLSRCRELFSQK